MLLYVERMDYYFIMKRTVFLTLILLTVVAPNPGVTAGGKITGADLVTGAEFTEIRFTFSQPAAYSLVPDLSRKVIKVVVQESGYDRKMEGRRYADVRVKDVTFYREERNSIAEIALADIKTSIYHTLSSDGLRLTVRLKSRSKLMAVKGKLKERERARPTEAELKMQALTNDSGRPLYQEALREMHNKQYLIAAEKFESFITKYPKSVYLERAHFTKGEALYLAAKKDKEKIPVAIDAFKLASAIYPKSAHLARARLRMGTLNFDQGMNLEALTLFDSLIKRFPKSKYRLSGLLGKANIYLARGEYNTAYNELERILLFFPKAKEVRVARFKIAESFYLRKRYETALQIFEDSDRKWPTYARSRPTTLAAYAETNLRLKRYDRAVELYAELANLFPRADEGKEAVNRIGDIYVIRGEIEAALKLFGEQARQRPEEKTGMDARLRLAAMGHTRERVIEEKDTVIWELPDYFHPMRSYEDIIEKHPESVQARDALYQKAWLLNQRKQYIKSVLTLKDLMVKVPATKLMDPVLKLVKDSLYQMVRDHHGQKGYYSVLAMYYESFDPFFKDVKEADIIMKVGDAYYEMGLHARSIEKFDQARDLDKENRYRDAVRYSKGRSYAAMRKFPEAIEMLETFMDLLDNSVYAPDALHLLGDIYNKKGDTETAVKTYMHAVAVAPKHKRISETAYRLGMLFKEGGSYRQAVNYFNMAIKSYRPLGERPDPFHVQESYFQLIEANYRNERFEEAISFADHALNRYPEHKQASWALYIKSDSETKISEDEKAADSLKALAKKEPNTVYGQIATASVQMIDWKLKFRELFN